MPLSILLFLSFIQGMDDPSPQTTGTIAESHDTFPYPHGEALRWEWISAGAEVGTTTVRFTPEPSKQQEKVSEWTLFGDLQWSGPGRRMQVKGQTRFTLESGQFQYTRRDRLLHAAGVGSQENLVVCQVQPDEKSVRIVSQVPEQGTQIDREIPFDRKSVVLESQCFEHWLLIGLHLPDQEQVKIKALIPSEYRTIDLTISKDRTETVGQVQTTRWNVQCSDFKAKIWVSEKGTIERYSQGELVIQRRYPDPPTEKQPAGNQGQGN